MPVEHLDAMDAMLLAALTLADQTRRERSPFAGEHLKRARALTVMYGRERLSKDNLALLHFNLLKFGLFYVQERVISRL